MSKKKILIISYYWPPAGGPAVQRVVKYVKHLREFNFEPIVLTVDNPQVQNYDESLLEQIPSDIRIVKTKWLQPFGIYKKLTKTEKSTAIPKQAISKSENEKFIDKLSRFVRANIFIPDARVGWFPYLVKAGLKLVTEENIEIIFSSAPPHSVHLGAKKIAEKTGIKWIADFRDPWIDAYWNHDLPKSFISKYIDRRLEKSVLKNADVITTVSPEVVELFRAKQENQYHVLHNGFENIELHEQKCEKFILLFIGSLTKYQNPEKLFEAINMLDQKKLEKTEVHFTGKVYPEFKALAARFTKIDFRINEYKPKEELLNYAQNCSILLFPVYTGNIYSKGIIGAKMFDYLSLRKPVLALGEKGSVVERLLEQTGSGKLFVAEEQEKIKEYISSKFEEWQTRGTTELEYVPSLDEYHTKFNVKKLTEICNILIGQC